MLRKRIICLSAILGALLCCGAPSFAADLPTRPPVQPVSVPELPEWTFSAMAYAWLPSVNGSSTIRGRTADIDASFGDLLHREIPKQLFGLMGAFEARNGRFGIMTDLVYMKLGASDSEARARSVHPHVGGTLAASMSAQFEMFIAETALAYELFRSQGSGPGMETALDLYGGGRFWWQRASADLLVSAGMNVGDLAVSGGRAFANSGDVTWFDPLIGLRLRHRFSPQVDMVLRGDVGGFSVGSKFSWQAMGYVNWEFARTDRAVWSAMLGYRALYVDYAKGEGHSLYEYDMLTHGPIMGVTARF
ncbi:hypothetical protein AFEL58S_02265 [Afipia felis]